MARFSAKGKQAWRWGRGLERKRTCLAQSAPAALAASRHQRATGDGRQATGDRRQATGDRRNW
ncbi:hypothetical protein CSW63_17130 [Caulobacter sp. FWC26]|nr:hypothetical protein CSW63_17130 [Caulobacter sp. FWC26]